MWTEQITQALGLCSEVPAQAINNQSKTAGSIDLSKFRRAFFLVSVGAVVGGGSLNFQLVEDAASNLGTATNLAGTGVSMTAFTTANKQLSFEVRADQITKRYVGLKVTETGSQNVNVCLVGFGADAVQKPGNAQNAASVNTQNVVS